MRQRWDVLEELIKILISGLRDERSLLVVGGGVESEEKSVVSVSIEAIVVTIVGMLGCVSQISICVFFCTQAMSN